MPSREDRWAAVARVFSRHPDRIAAAWRRLRGADRHAEGLRLLEGVVEPFVRALGESLAGAPGSPWSRTQGVLRLSTARGATGLHDEFESLRHCAQLALDALQASARERAFVARAIAEALDSAVALMAGLEGQPVDDPEPVPFGGLVVEVFEPRLRLHPAADAPRTSLPSPAGS